MTDTITLPSGVEIYEGKVLVIPGASTMFPIGNLTPAEVEALRAQVAAAMGQELGDLANVSETGKATGKALVAQPDGSWAPTTVSGAISRIGNAGTTENSYDVNHISLRNGVRFVESSPGVVFIEVVFGSSGVLDMAARADHVHPPMLTNRFTFDKAAAVLGAGTNPLVNQTVTGLVPTAIYDITVSGTLEAVNTNSSGKLRLYTQIGTATAQSIVRGFSGGVWTSVTVNGTRMSVTGVTSLQLQFWAEYHSGDPTALYTGELAYAMTPRGGLT